MAPLYELYFTGSQGNPRQCIIIGQDVEPVFIRFETPEVYMPNTRTTITRNQNEQVAIFDWTAQNYLGLATVRGRAFPMAQLIQGTDNPYARAFEHDRQKYEWRRLEGQRGNYELWAQNTKIAMFRTVNQQTPVGPAHGILGYTFVKPDLLLQSMLALCVNRWIDLQGV